MRVRDVRAAARAAAAVPQACRSSPARARSRSRLCPASPHDRCTPTTAELRVVLPRSPDSACAPLADARPNPRIRRVVLEVALIDVTDADAFEAAYRGARHLLVDTPGCRTVRMTRGIESPKRFVLLVEWESVDAHEINFRQTETFRAWRTRHRAVLRHPTSGRALHATWAERGTAMIFVDRLPRASSLLVLLGASASRFVARRMLGVPVGWPRSIVIGMILFSLASAASCRGSASETGINERPPRTTTGIVVAVAVFLLVLAWGFFLSIAALVVLELIMPTGSLGTPWAWVRTIRDRNRRTRRYLQVLGIATRNGLGGFLGSSTAGRPRYGAGRQHVGDGARAAQRAQRGRSHLHQDRPDAVQPPGSDRTGVHRRAVPPAGSLDTRPLAASWNRSWPHPSRGRWQRSSPRSTPSRWPSPRWPRCTRPP